MKANLGVQTLLGSVLMALLVAPPPVAAQGRPAVQVPAGWSISHVRVEGNHRRASRLRAPRSEDRALTVRREFAPEAGDVFAGTAYNNIRAFDPVPSIDSGIQLPYGLDGIGGYGSDLGFTAAQDAAVYDRGP